MSDEDIVVIGAGQAGQPSACLRHEGLSHVVLEREAEVASAWRRHDDRLHLHTSKRYSGLPLSPWPRQAPAYPSRAGGGLPARIRCAARDIAAFRGRGAAGPARG